MVPSRTDGSRAPRFRRIGLALALLGITASAVTGAAHACGDDCALHPRQLGLVQVSSSISADRDKSSAELREDKREVESQIDATEDALAKAGKKVKNAVAVFQDVDSRWRIAQGERRDALAEARAAREEARLAQARAASARALLQAATARQKVVEGQLVDIHDQMDTMARAVYTQGPLAEIEVILDAQTPGDFTARLASVDAVSRMQAGVQRSLKRTEADLVMQGVRLESLRIEAETEERAAGEALAKARAALGKAREKQAKVAELRGERKDALQEAQVHRSEIKKRYEDLVAEQERLAAAARRAAAEEERRRKEAEQAARKAAEEALARGEEPPPPAEPSFTATGSLMMPVNGTPSSNPGPRIHPIFNRQSCHTGWDLAAPTGTSVVAADNGSVASIGNGGPYGKSVMIAHGDGLVTFYAHLNSIGVSSGQIVNKGQVIGTVGSTGWSTGPHLHFETHINGKPYDPRGWFGGSRTPINC